MVKECTVILNNDAVTVVVYDGIRVQLPSIKRKAQSVFVDKRGSRYIVVDKPHKSGKEPRQDAFAPDDTKKQLKTRAKKKSIDVITDNI